MRQYRHVLALADHASFRKASDGSRLALEELAAIAHGRPEIAEAIVAYAHLIRANLDAIVRGMPR
jgi:hypothetical protein